MSSYATSPYSGVPTGMMTVAPGSASRPKARAALSPAIVSGDYSRDANGDIVDGDPTTEEVQFLLSTVEGFVSHDGYPRGNTAFKIRAFTDDSFVQIRDRVLIALRSALERGSISDVTVTPDPYAHDGSTAVLSYTVTFKATGIR